MLDIGNRPFDTTDQDLKERFGRFGQVVSAQVVMDRDTGRSRGYAFLLMDSGGDEAIQSLHSTEFQGRTLTVNVAGGRWSNLRRPSRNTS